MEASNFEVVFLKILKRLMLVAIGSGLLGNSLYIYGLGYYQGYIESLGFEYNLFPVEWSDTLLWTYAASRELGVSSIGLISKFTSPALLILLASFYLIARIWMQLSKVQPSGKVHSVRNKINFKLAKKIFFFKKKHIWAYRIIYLPFRWLLIKEQSFIAFAASYFFMFFLIFIPIFIITWIYFPLFGVNHGKLVAEKRLKHYETYLCGDSDEYWSQCMKIDASEIKNHGDIADPIGRVLFKNGNLVAVLTKNGPITLSMPKVHYFKTEVNPCYEKGCEEKDEVSYNNTSKSDS